MKLAEVREKAFAMPLNDPSYPKGPYKFYNREFVVITYRTDIDKLREVVPEPLEVAGDTVAYRNRPSYPRARPDPGRRHAGRRVRACDVPG